MLLQALLGVPHPTGPPTVDRPGVGAPLEPGAPLRGVCWNLQYAAGRRRRFFYDGGDAVHADVGDVLETLAGITLALRALDADVTLLQEVDRGSARTGGLDELRALDALGYPAVAATSYHRARIVPFPPRRWLGRVDMQLATHSRFGVAWAERVPLPLMAESRVRRLFNLRRAVLETHVPIADGRTLVLLNTHLSAFSYGDGTLEKQIGAVLERTRAADRAGHPWILAGDFNALPPGDHASRLGADAKEYPEQASPLEPLFRELRAPLSPAELVAGGARWATYQPWGGTPDRCLDYVFHSSAVSISNYDVHPAHARWSDHLPLTFEAIVL
jgi:endonuclease/exonuclease/phosphatase family metal-dependent hydrolase